MTKPKKTNSGVERSGITGTAQRVGDYPEFFRIVDAQLGALGKQWDDFPKGTVPKSTVSNWRSRKSRPQPAHLNAIAVTLAGWWQSQINDRRAVSGDARPMSRLHSLVNELFVAAKYPVPVVGRPTDQVYADRYLNKQSLRVGVFTWSPLADKDETGTWSGLTYDLMPLMASLMGTHFEPVSVPWPNTVSALLKGDVDLMAPLYLRLPFKLAEVQLSDPIPRLRCKLNGAVSAAVREKLLVKVDGKYVIDRSKLTFVLTQSSITHCLADLLTNSMQISDPTTGRARPATEDLEFTSISEGWSSLEQQPEDDSGRIRVFPTEQFTCEEARRSSKGRIVPLFDDEVEHVPISLGVSMATHLGEPQLMNAINTAIGELRRHSAALDKIYARYDYPDRPRLTERR
jgi:hypothetical protein